MAKKVLSPVQEAGLDLDMAECGNCQWKGPAQDCEEIADFWSRVDPGDTVPSGDCPDCGAFCFPVKTSTVETGGALAVALGGIAAMTTQLETVARFILDAEAGGNGEGDDEGTHEMSIDDAFDTASCAVQNARIVAKQGRAILDRLHKMVEPVPVPEGEVTPAPKYTGGNLECVQRVPPHSADAECVLIDTTSDNGDVLAIIDPDGIMRELRQDPVRFGKLLALAPEMAEALTACQEYLPGQIARKVSAILAKLH